MQNENKSIESKPARKPRSKYLSRKFIATTGTLVVVFFLEYVHPGSGKNLEIIVPACLASYHGVNGVLAWAAKGK